MKIDKRYYCFGCGETGDAIDLVAKYFGLAPKEAAMKIASDFGLNYDATNRAPPKRVEPQKTKEQILDEEQRHCLPGRWSGSRKVHLVTLPCNE